MTATASAAIAFGDSLFIALDDCRSQAQVENFAKTLAPMMTTTQFPNIVAEVIEEARRVWKCWKADPEGMYAAIYGEMFNEEAMYEAAQDAWASRAYGADPAWAQ